MAFTEKKILIIHSQQPANQYAGGGTGVGDSEQYWMRKLAEEMFAELKTTGHDVRLGPKGTSTSTYRTNVAWVNSSENRDAALVLDPHSNATGKAGDHPVGIGVYHHPKSTKGRAFAEKLLPYLKPVSAANKVYRSVISVAEVADTTPPVLLVEHEYHDWAGGAEWIRNPANRTALAKAYRKYIVDMWGSKEIPAPVVFPKTITLQGRILAYHEQGLNTQLEQTLDTYYAKGSHFDAPRWRAFIERWTDLDTDLPLTYGVPTKLTNDEKQALVVLGSGLKADGTMSGKFLRRLKMTATVAKAYPATKIIVSGGSPKNGITEGKLGKMWLVEHGIDAPRIFIEVKSASTVSNARYTMPILLAQKFSSYAIISDASHLRRAAVLFEAALLQHETAVNLDTGLKCNALIAYKDVSHAEAEPGPVAKRTNAYHTSLLLGIEPQYTAARKL